MNAAFKLQERQVQQSDNLEIYIFTTNVQTYRFTSYAEDVVIDGDNYISVPALKRSGFTRDLSRGIMKCNIQAPITTFFAQYIMATPTIPVQVEIKKYYFTDLTNSAAVFFGIINSFSIQGQFCLAECISSTYGLNRKIPRVFVQSQCNNILYDDICGLDWTMWRAVIAVTIDPIDNTVLSAAFFGTKPKNYYRFGRAESQGEIRFITSHIDNEITIHFPIRHLSDGDNIIISPGCNKTIIECRDKFNNLDKFTGMPDVPCSANPIIWGVKQ